jgi:hypothetical protein
MFIELPNLRVLRCNGAKYVVRRRIHLPVHCAPLERQTMISREVYKHLAPPEQERWLVGAPLRYYSTLRATQMIETPNGKFM